MRTIELDGAEHEIARGAAQGHRAAQRDLFRRLASPVQATLYHVLGSNDGMEELLQDAFVEIFRSLPAYDRKLDLHTWACAVAIRVVCRHLQSDTPASQRMLDRRSRVEYVGRSESSLPVGVGLKQVYALLRSLEPEQHVTLALSMMARRSVSEIAALTGVDDAVVRERIGVARHLLCSAARDDSGLMASIAQHPLAD